MKAFHLLCFGISTFFAIWMHKAQKIFPITELLSPLDAFFGLEISKYAPLTVISVIANIYLAHHILMLDVSLSLIGLGRNFQYYMDQLEEGFNRVENIFNGARQYLLLKKMVERINQLFGSCFLSLYAIIITYYCEIPEMLGREPSPHAATDLLFVVINTIVFVTAAEFHSTVEKTFMQWYEKITLDLSSNDTSFIRVPHQFQDHPFAGLQNSKYYLPLEVQLKLMDVKNDQRAHPVALCCPYFAVTNGLLCSVQNLETQ